MLRLDGTPGHVDRFTFTGLRGLLTGVSAFALLAAAPQRAAAEPRGMWNPGAAAAAQAAAAASVGAQQSAAAAAQAQQALISANSAIRGMWDAQAAARAAAAAVAPGNIVNGLGKGTAGQIPGLVVDPRVPKDLAHPTALENPNLWLNASLPSQTTRGGQTIVDIHQTAPQAVMTWEYFNIGPSTTLVFDQQGHANWVALNRIDATGKPSEIHGRIQADGTVLVINPNGIVFTGTSQVNVGSLIASALDIDTTANTTVFNAADVALGTTGAEYTRLTLPGGVLVDVPPREADANKAFVQNGLFAAGDSTTTQRGVRFALGNQSLGRDGGGAISVRAGASITTHVSEAGDGGTVALLGTSVTNAGGISTPGGQAFIAARNEVALATPAAAATGADRKLSDVISDAVASQIHGNNGAPPDLNGTALVVNAANGILEARNGAVTLIGDHIDQLGDISVTTSATRTGSVTLSAQASLTGADGDIILGPRSLVAILPDEASGTIPSASATADFFASTLQPRITFVAGGDIALLSGARIKAPAAKLELNRRTLTPDSPDGIGTILLEPGSVIDLSGLRGVSLPLENNEVSILLTANELANSPLARSLVGQRVTIDARLRGTRADGVDWVGSPLLEATGSVGLIQRSIEELLTVGGALISVGVQNFIQQPGSVIDVSGGFVTYEGGTIKTTQLQAANGRIYDIGSADPTIPYIGIAGQFVVDHPHWGVKETFTDSLRGQGRYEPTYISGTSAGAVTIAATVPILAGTIEAETFTGIRQRAGARGGGAAPEISTDDLLRGATNPVQPAGSDQLPYGAALALVLLPGQGLSFELNLEPRAAAGRDPYGLGSFTLETAATWVPKLAGDRFPIFSDVLSETGYGSIRISGRGDRRDPLVMKAGATLEVRPGGRVTLDNVTRIDGTIRAQSGSVTLTGKLNRTTGDLVIGPTAMLDVRGLWVNDRSVAGAAIQGRAFIDGGSVTIETPTSTTPTEATIRSGIVLDANGNSIDVTGQKFLVSIEDTSQSIVLAPGSVVDASSGGYIGADGRLRFASDGVPAGKGGNVTLRTYVNSGDAQLPTGVTKPNGNVGFYRLNPPTGMTTAESPVVIDDGTESGKILPAGLQIRARNAGETGEYPSGIEPTDGLLRANVVLGGTIRAESFEGGGTLNLVAPSIKIGGVDQVTSYLLPESLAGIASATGLPVRAFTRAGTGNIGTSGARVEVSAARGGELTLPAGFFDGNSFGSYVLTSAVGDIAVNRGTTVNLRQSNLLPGGSPGKGLDTAQPTGAIPRDFATLGSAADGLRKPVDLTLFAPNGPSGVLVDKGAVIAADARASGPANVSLLAFNGLETVLGGIIAPSGAINLLGGSVWIGRDAVLDVGSMFVPNPRITTYATGSLLDAGTITLAGPNVVVEAGAQLRLEGGATIVQAPDLTATTRQRYVDVPLWSNGGSLDIGGDNLYFAGSVSAGGGAAQAAGGSLTIGNIPVPKLPASVASFIPVSAAPPSDTLIGHIEGPRTIVVEPAGNVVRSLDQARRTSGITAPYPTTPGDLLALVPHNNSDGSQIAGGYIAADALSESGFDSIGFYTGTIAFNGSLRVSVPGAATLVASAGQFVLLPASASLLPTGVTYSGTGNWAVDPGIYTSRPGPNGIPGIGGARVTLDAGYLRFVGGADLPRDDFQNSILPRVADGRLEISAKWIDLQGLIGLGNVLDTELTGTGAIRLLPPAYGNPNVAGAFAGALATMGNLTLAAAQIFPVSGTQFLLASLGTHPGVDDRLTILQNGVPTAPLSAGGGIVLYARTIEQAGTLWAPLGSITLGLTTFDQLPQLIKSSNAGQFFGPGQSDSTQFIPTNRITLAAGSLTSVSATALAVPYGYTIDGANWVVGEGIGNVIVAPPAKAISSFGANIAMRPGAVIDARGGGDVYATEFVAGTSGTRNVLTTGAAGQTVYALVPESRAAVAAYDPSFVANYRADSSAIAPGTAVDIGEGAGIPAGRYVLLPGMYATLPGAYRIVEVAHNANPTGPGAVAAADGSVFVQGTFSNALTGSRSAQTSLFQLQRNGVWRQYSRIDITSGTAFFHDLHRPQGVQIPALPVDGGLLALGATRSLDLAGINRFGPGTSPLAPRFTGRGGEVDISARNILVLAADRKAPPRADDPATPYVVLDADQISKLGASRVVIGGSSTLDRPGTIVAAAENVEVLTDAAHPLAGPELILVTLGSVIDASTGTPIPSIGYGITVDTGSVIRAEGPVPAGTARDIHLTSITVDPTDGNALGDGALLRVAVGAPVEIVREHLGQSPAGRITIGTEPGTGDLPTTPGAAVSIIADALTLDSADSNVLSPNSVLKVRHLDLAANVVNIGGGSSGLVLTEGIIANFAGAESIRLRSASVFNFFDAHGLVVGDTTKPIGTLTFDGAGFFSEGGTSTVDARDVVLTNTKGTERTDTALEGANGTLAINASGTFLRGPGDFRIAGFSEVGVTASQSIGFSGSGELDAGPAHVVLAAPTLVANKGSTQSLTTTGLLEIRNGVGRSLSNDPTNIGGALTLTGASIRVGGRVEALAGDVTLRATTGDLTLGTGAEILAKGSQFAVVDQSVAAPGGNVKLTAARNVTIAEGAKIDVSAVGHGYAGSLDIETGESGVATLRGLLRGGAAFDDIGGRFELTAGRLLGGLPFDGGFTGSFSVALKRGDISIGQGTTLTSGNVRLVADGGRVIVGGTIDAKGPRAGSIAFFGAEGVTIESGAQLIARYEAVGLDDPGYANGTSLLVQRGGTITLGTTGTPDGTVNATYGYQNVTSSGSIQVASGAIFDVRGGPGGTGVDSRGGEVVLRAPILKDGRVNVGFHGTLVTNARGRDAGRGVVLDAYAVWSTADATTGPHHFDGIIDPAGWYGSNRILVAGTFTDAFGTPVAEWDGSTLTSFDFFSDQLSYYLANAYFSPTTLNSDHIGFYQETLKDFVRGFAAMADFSGARLRVGDEPAVALPTSLQHARPEIALANPSAAINQGDISVLGNWNLGAGEFDGNVDSVHYRPYYRTGAGEPGVLTLQAANNIDVRATISDGFYETRDAFGGSELVANRIDNNPRMSGDKFDYNTTSAAGLMSVVEGINNGSFSYNFVAGAAFDASGRPSVDPEAVIEVADGETGKFSISGHTTYVSPLDNGGFTPPINVPSLLRTGTGSITITTAADFEIVDELADIAPGTLYGAIYTAGAAAVTPAGFAPPRLSPVYELFPNGLVSTPAWATAGGSVKISAGRSIVGIASTVNDADNFVTRVGQDWNQWYFHSGFSNGTSAPFARIGTCADASVTCQTAAWVNYATFKGIGALGGGDISLAAGKNISSITASLPETLVVSGGVDAGDPPVAHYYGGGNLSVRAGGDVESGTFLVGRGAGRVAAGGSVRADPRQISDPLSGSTISIPPLLLAVQDGFVSAAARGPVTLGAVYDPASLPLSYIFGGGLVGGATPLAYAPNGVELFDPDTLTFTPTAVFGALFTTYGPLSGVALSSISGDIKVLGNGDTAFQGGGLSQPVAVPFGKLLPATLKLTALSGNVAIDTMNGDAKLLPYPTPTGDYYGTLSIVAAKNISITNGALTMPDLDTRAGQYLGNLQTTTTAGDPGVHFDNYVGPLGIPLPNLTQALHANDPSPVIIAAGHDIDGLNAQAAPGQITAGVLQLIKPARIVAGHDVFLDFVGQNNNSSDITSIKAGDDIGGFAVDIATGAVTTSGTFYLYGPGALLLEAGRNFGPLRLSAAASDAPAKTAGVATIGDGSNVGGFLTESAGNFLMLSIVPYLPSKGADITVRFGVGPGTDYDAAISQFVDPARAGSRGIDLLAEIASVLGVSRDDAWTRFQGLSTERRHLLIDRAFLDFLTRVATDYNNKSSPFFGRYSRAYDAIATLYPASLGYTDNSGTGGGLGATSLVTTGQLNIAQSVLETQMGGDIDIIGPGGGITVGTASRDALLPRQEGILTLGGGTISVFTDATIALNQSRIMTLQGGDINLFSANGDISAGEGPKTYVSNPPITSICDLNGFCRVNPSGLVTGAGIGALITLPGQNPSLSNVSLVAPRGTVDAGAAGIRVSGNLNIVAVRVLNAYNIQSQGSVSGIAAPPSTNVGALTSASNVAGSTQASIASSQARGGANDVASVFIVEVIGYGGSSSGDQTNDEGRRQ